jgi:hypothetical protein
MDLAEHAKYRERIWSALTHCPFLDDQFRLVISCEPSEIMWTKIHFRVEARFHDGSRLIVQEIFSADQSPPWKRDRKVQKKICYQYMDAENALIFRLDSHHMPVDLGAALHLDIVDRKHIEEGDPFLRGISVANSDFFTAFEWIGHRLSGQSLPWEVQDAKA